MSPYSLSPELYRQIRAFLCHLAHSCNTCLRKHMSCCDSCDAHTARIIVNRMDADFPPPPYGEIDTSLAKRMEVILDILRKANRPLRSIDIDTRDYCSKELKLWTLGRLISLGKVRRERQGYFHVYSLATEKQTTKRKN